MSYHRRHSDDHSDDQDGHRPGRDSGTCVRAMRPCPLDARAGNDLRLRQQGDGQRGDRPNRLHCAHRPLGTDPHTDSASSTGDEPGAAPGTPLRRRPNRARIIPARRNHADMIAPTPDPTVHTIVRLVALTATIAVIPHRSMIGRTSRLRCLGPCRTWFTAAITSCSPSPAITPPVLVLRS